MQSLDELIKSKEGTYYENEPETAEVFRTRGMSYWHWGYCLNGTSYAFYNSRVQAEAARQRRINVQRSQV